MVTLHSACRYLPCSRRMKQHPLSAPGSKLCPQTRLEIFYGENNGGPCLGVGGQGNTHPSLKIKKRKLCSIFKKQKGERKYNIQFNK